MKNPFLLGLSSLVVVAALLAGCNTSTEPVEDELSALESMILEDELFTSDKALLNDAGAFNLAKTTAPILPAAWGRRIDSVSRTVTFDRSGDTVVVATIVFTMSGQVKIAAKDSPGDTSITIVSKPFTESTTRRVRLTKIANTDRPRNNWRFREISGVDGGTTTSSAIAFNEMVVIMGQDTLTVTDPTQFYLRFAEFAFMGRRLPTMGTSTNTTVRLTVTSTESDTDLVFLHRAFQRMNTSFMPLRVRMNLVSQTGSGPYTFFVSGITRNSLFDDAAPWSTKIWGIPYIVSP
jgi:hypothetical protein